MSFNSGKTNCTKHSTLTKAQATPACLKDLSAKQSNSLYPSPTPDYFLHEETSGTEKETKNSMLEPGEYFGAMWSEQSYHGKALVLWDLDQGSWGKSRFNTWIEKLEIMIGKKFDINKCCHFGALNCHVPGRKQWRNLLSNFNTFRAGKKSIKKDWAAKYKNFKLEVLECQPQAVDQRLIQFCKKVMKRNDKPQLVVIISHDNDMIPIINCANSNEIDNMVVRWRKCGPDCDINKVARHSIRVDKNSCLEIL